MQPAKGPGIALPAKTAAVARIAQRTAAPAAFVSKSYKIKRVRRGGLLPF